MVRVLVIYYNVCVSRVHRISLSYRIGGWVCISLVGVRGLGVDGVSGVGVCMSRVVRVRSVLVRSCVASVMWSMGIMVSEVWVVTTRGEPLASGILLVARVPHSWTFMFILFSILMLTVIIHNIISFFSISSWTIVAASLIHMAVEFLWWWWGTTLIASPMFHWV